jgi:hypothetical protein
LQLENHPYKNALQPTKVGVDAQNSTNIRFPTTASLCLAILDRQSYGVDDNMQGWSGKLGVNQQLPKSRMLLPIQRIVHSMSTSHLG